MVTKRLIHNFRKLPTWALWLHISAKVIFMFGLGILLATYFPGSGWQIAGWIIIAFAIIESIPSTYLIMSHKYDKKK